MEKRSQKTSDGLIRIAITGPESTGKSQLSEKLATHFNTVFVPEFAREYIGHLNREYNFDDLEIIAKGQIAAQKKAEKKANSLIFCDTELTVIKIWAEYKYQKSPEWVTKKLSKFTYDLYLLCDVDLPWEFDPQREHPDLRSYFFNLYKNELMRRNLNFSLISGHNDERVNCAIRAVDKMLKVLTDK